MKKKKLKQRIAELELKLRQEKSRSGAWQDISHRFISELKEHGVKTEITFAEPTVVETSRVEDMQEKYIHGIGAAQPTLSFDFTEHDEKIIYDFKSKCKENNEPEEITQCKEFLKKENKCYIYITNFFAQPMIYEDLGFSCGYMEVPIAKIRYTNGAESEVALTELMRYDTLEKCEKRCEELNEEMKEYRESRNKDSWRLNQFDMENKKDD